MCLYDEYTSSLHVLDNAIQFIINEWRFLLTYERDNYIKLGKTPRKIGIRLFSENILTTLHKSFKKLVEWFMRSCFGKKNTKKNTYVLLND